MNKFEWALSQSGFLAVKDQLISELQTAIESKLRIMGDDVRGISWFSSVAHDLAQAETKRAA